MSGSILLVDDTPSVRQALGGLLELEGYRVDAVASAEEAIEEFDQGDVGLLLADVTLPRMGGEELAARLSWRRPGLPVILISGYPDAGARAERILGPVRFLAKPFSAAELRDAIEDALAA